MRQECIEAVANAVGRSLKADEIRGVEERIARHLRDGKRKDPDWLGKSEADRLYQAAGSAANELLGEAAKKQQRVALTIIAHDRIQTHLSDLAAKGVTGLDAIKRMIAFHADTKGNTMSIETQAKTIERDALRQMLGVLEASNPKFFGLFENMDGIRAIIREMFGENSGIREAREGVGQWKTVTEALRQRFNRAGGDVGQLEDWGMPHHHSQQQVAKAGREQWVADILPQLNRDRYLNEDGSLMNDEQITGFLNEAWLTIATGGANKQTPGTPQIGGMRANRGSESRQIHFKDADSYIAYQEKYGERSLYEVLVGHISGVAKNIALVETLGPNADATYRLFRDQAVKEAEIADPTKLGKIQKEAISADNLYNMVSGKTMPVASEWLANTFDTLRSWLVASRLGSAVISSLSDEATLQLTARINNLPQMRILANELAALNPANQVEKRMALRAGLAMNTFISSLNRFGQDGLGASFSSKLASSVMRASGLNALTEARKRAFGVTMMSSLGQLTKDFDSLGKLDTHDHRILLSKGITETDFAVWRKAALEDWGNGNDTMLTLEAIYRIPDEVLAKIDPNATPQALREKAATRLLGTVLEETDMAVIEPGLKERAMMMSNLQRGTWKGELTRSFFLFKSFPISMISRHWTRAMDAETAGGKVAYIATLMAATTVLGAASMQINEVLSGRDPRNLNPFEKGGVRNWIQAMLKGGSLGIYGDFLFSESSQYGGSPIAAALGPVVGMAEDVLNLSQGNLVQMALGKETHAGAELVKFVKANTPGANLWFAKAALDRLVFHQLQEHFSPGYLSRMRSRASREFGQRYWWAPGQVEPDRAPDLSAMAGG
ncbi:MAG TPA: hypothetical protein DHV59_01600 [Oxalobacteraceae bacterium]|nr:hypothetical protein [Oxalobacteraceae bacterium]